MRIAYVLTRSDDLGGVQVHVRDLSEAMRRRGHEVLVVAGGSGVLTEQLQSRGIPVRSVPALGRAIRPRRDLAAFLQLRSELRRFRPDLISAHSTKAGVLGRLAGRSLGVPTVFTAHGWRFSVGPLPMRWMYRATERTVGRLAARIITVSDVDRDLALKNRVAKAERIVTVRNAMRDVEENLRADPGRRSLPGIIMVGRFMQQKDQDTLLRALSGLTRMEWTLDLVGEGPRREQVEELARQLQLQPRVRFLGLRTDVPELLAQAQIFALVSHWEGLPRSIIEAMRAGLPTVATDVGGVREAVVDGETGYLIPSKDIEALRLRLGALLDDRDLRRELGQMARSRYEELFTFDRLAARTLAVYEDIIGEGSSGAAPDGR